MEAWGTTVCRQQGLTVSGQELGSEQPHLGLAWSAWVLDFMQERFHNMSPGGFESTFIKAGDSETSKGLRHKKQQERA